VGYIIVDEKVTLCWISEGIGCKNVNLNLLTMKSEEGLEKRSMNVILVRNGTTKWSALKMFLRKDLHTWVRWNWRLLYSYEFRERERERGRERESARACFLLRSFYHLRSRCNFHREVSFLPTRNVFYVIFSIIIPIPPFLQRLDNP
jgi:hypothetical protein